MERNTKEDLHCTLSMHPLYRSLLGQINWLQSRTEFQCCFIFSKCASMAVSPTIGDVKYLNKLARQIKPQPVKLQYWPLTGPLKLPRFLDASYRNNDDGSSQKGMTVFLAGSRERSSTDGMSDGSLVITSCLIRCSVRSSGRLLITHAIMFLVSLFHLHGTWIYSSVSWRLSRPSLASWSPHRAPRRWCVGRMRGLQNSNLHGDDLGQVTICPTS